MVTGGQAEKAYHRWQQNLDGMRTLVEKLTVPGELVFDPFACTCTTGVAALQLGRQFIGAEIDPKIINAGAARLNEAEGEWLAQVGAASEQVFAAIEEAKEAAARDAFVDDEMPEAAE